MNERFSLSEARNPAAQARNPAAQARNPADYASLLISKASLATRYGKNNASGC